MTCSEEEQYLLRCINALRLSYERDAKPYLDRLVELRNMKRPPLVVPLEEWEKFQSLTQWSESRKTQ